MRSCKAKHSTKIKSRKPRRRSVSKCKSRSKFAMSKTRSLKSTRKLTSNMRKSILKIKAPKTKSRKTRMRLTQRLSLIKRGTNPIVPDRTRNAGGINDLPVDALRTIFSHLSGNDLARTAQVSSLWYNLSRENNEVKLPLQEAYKLKKKYPHVKVIPILLTSTNDDIEYMSDGKYSKLFNEFLFYDDIGVSVRNNPVKQNYFNRTFNRVIGAEDVDGKKMARVRNYSQAEMEKLSKDIVRSMGYIE